MTGTAVNTQTPPTSPDQDFAFDIFTYLSVIVRWRWIIAASIFLATSLSALYASRLPDVFESAARVSIVDRSDPGGVTPDDRRAPEVLTLVEHGFVLGNKPDNHQFAILAQLRSRPFGLLFLERAGVYAHLYPEHWDSESRAWRDGFVPDRGEAFDRFTKDIRFITFDEITGIVRVSMRWTDAAIARDWANAYVELFNEHVRSNALEEVARRHAFLRAELQQQTVVEIQQSIYRLIEAQTAVEMLMRGRHEFALATIDNAMLSYHKFGPARKRLVLYAAFAGAMLSIMTAIGWTVFCALRDHLKPYLTSAPTGTVTA